MTPKDRKIEKPARACLCCQLPFTALRAMAQASGWRSVEEIASATGCGEGCGLCRPYLARMLETGETAFAVLR
jgi:bacterioferritin-associated ferredoxin